MSLGACKRKQHPLERAIFLIKTLKSNVYRNSSNGDAQNDALVASFCISTTLSTGRTEVRGWSAAVSEAVCQSELDF